ncbi:YraN family protein [Roseivirga misakiensis]|uniref:UPF0102 protein BFP71_06705 n=1 Tax=Roseivirga misakiensis TaxID=1563681 RepID=A0A1E5T352_9BACT|nr:YraN family protein [Roseivirga misakiensis]OEK05804.1 hypothetical protein BFP71_06705 [Roseivirga misakiensis]
MQTFGKKGEDIACDFLEEIGYEIISRNYRFKRSEIDIICNGEGLLIFVEVKTRTSRAFGQPETFVSESQQIAINSGAEEYLTQSNWLGDIRFDVVSVILNKDESETFHIKDAFY